ncbi:MAG: hypothetical protein KDG56_19170 [Ottowia sp.]|nr:hypothetical protein [Ottowia sp.]
MPLAFVAQLVHPPPRARPLDAERFLPNALKRIAVGEGLSLVGRGRRFLSLFGPQTLRGGRSQLFKV